MWLKQALAGIRHSRRRNLQRIASTRRTLSAASLNADFAREVDQGLSQTTKCLPHKYNYNERGDELWRQVTALSTTNYCTKCEYEIFSEQKQAISAAFTAGGSSFRLIDLGTGDGVKTKLLLRHLVANNADFRFAPVDISGSVLDLLTNSLAEEIPALAVDPIQEDYFQAMSRLDYGNDIKKVVMMIGANITIYEPHEAVEFLAGIAKHLNKGDLILIGFDLKKDPEILVQNYQDPDGVYESFAMNIMDVANEQLGANFDVSAFKYAPSYHALAGKVFINAISCKEQSVYIKALDKSYDFEAWEAVNLYFTQKYSLPDIESLARRAGFQPVQHFLDSRHYFVDTLWTVP